MRRSASVACLGAVLVLSAAACRSRIPDASWGDARLSVALLHGGEDERIQAAILLSKRPTPADLWPFVKALGDERWEVRDAAAQGLGRLGDPRALVPLEHSLRDGHWWVRAGAAQALGALGSPRAAPFLRASRADENDAVREAADEALEAVGASP
ncbi:MAG: HEAT repeat domain-containing protein [Elusimicrobia bacterium]|nr:HEAT repeat domain-containing protein [Elusimicrobiota bacterium]